MQRNTLHSPSSKHRARSLGSVHKSRSSFILELVVSPEGDKRSTPVRSFITDFDLFNSRTNVVRIWWAIASGRGRQYDPWKSSNDTTVVAENIGQPQFQEYPVRSHEDSSQACRPALKRNVTCIGMSVSFSHAAVASTSSRCWATVVRNKSLSEYLNLLGVVVFLSDVKQWRSLNVVHSAVWTPIRKTWFFHAASWTKHCPLKSITAAEDHESWNPSAYDSWKWILSMSLRHKHIALHSNSTCTSIFLRLNRRTQLHGCPRSLCLSTTAPNLPNNKKVKVTTASVRYLKCFDETDPGVCVAHMLDQLKAQPHGPRECAAPLADCASSACATRG